MSVSCFLGSHDLCVCCFLGGQVCIDSFLDGQDRSVLSGFQVTCVFVCVVSLEGRVCVCFVSWEIRPECVVCWDARVYACFVSGRSTPLTCVLISRRPGSVFAEKQWSVTVMFPWRPRSS